MDTTLKSKYINLGSNPKRNSVLKYFYQSDCNPFFLKTANPINYLKPFLQYYLN